MDLLKPLSTLALTLTLILGVSSAAHADSDYTTLRFHSETGVQMYKGGFSSVGQLTMRYRFAENFYADVVGRSGTVHARSQFEDQFYLALAAGPGITTGEAPDGWEFRLSPRVTHVHHATTASWRATPIANMLGDSDGGVEHRTGLELALGVTGSRFGRLGQRRFIWSADVITNLLPSSDVMRYGVGAVVGISLTRN